MSLCSECGKDTTDIHEWYELNPHFTKRQGVSYLTYDRTPSRDVCYPCKRNLTRAYVRQV